MADEEVIDRQILTQAVVRVADGRGFVVERQNYLGRPERIVITAAHCLPELPPRHPASHPRERTFRVLGSLKGEPTVLAECLFVELIADIAVLGAPSAQEFSAIDAKAYEKLVNVTPLPVADAPEQGTRPSRGSGSFNVPTPGKGAALVLSLAGEWIECTVTRRSNGLSVDQRKLIESGMSGSPILSPAGQAIGAVSTEDFSPVLLACLPPHIKVRQVRP